MADFTPTQGRYLAFIHAYINFHGYPPAESEIRAAMGVSPPSVHQMVKMLEKKGLILREPGQARSLRLVIPADKIPPWNRDSATDPAPTRVDSPLRRGVPPPATAEALYVLSVHLLVGATRKKFARKGLNRGVVRVFEIRGDQTLGDLHDAIFRAYDRWDDHLYEFQFGERPFDPKVTYGVSGEEGGDAGATKLSSLGLKPNQIFGYWFDFGDNWYHQVQVERIEQASPGVTYPREIKRVGESPPQYRNDDGEDDDGIDDDDD